ncbi:PTS system, sucrose-specific IIB component / PTS system, sucrose-specific IIC component [Staphylococcus aureus]|uniref:PTS system, sucrose-specific IIB component / PTS system, sucrose-specific IIC component n=1 Tax=Staphylococcus aureus TaxID=1280 RepID=A0A380EPA4_STAAU|nr:PTS system, sucrose-specific IIB component / PTS system, sucrose-specific IIC component [Staphylococcus aureus]
MFCECTIYIITILIGFSAAKRFGGNPFLGAALGMILVHPSLMSAYDFPKAVEAGKAIPYWDVLVCILIK